MIWWLHGGDAFQLTIHWRLASHSPTTGHVATHIPVVVALGGGEGGVQRHGWAEPEPVVAPGQDMM